MLRTTTRGAGGPNRTAEQAWDQLVSAIESTGETARSAQRRARHLTGDAQDRVGATADEARYRARLALNALAGRREPPPWRLIIGLTVAGVVAGWVAAVAARRAAVVMANETAHEDEPFGEEVQPSA